MSRVRDVELPGGWRDRLEAVSGGRAHARGALALVGAALLISIASWTRHAPALIAPPSVSPTVSSGSAPSAAPSVASGAIFVHVAGAVRKPGLYQLIEGQRVADAVAAAGGATDNADLGGLNLAEILEDAAKVDVPRRGEATSSAPTGAASPGPTDAGLAPVDLNTADQAQLEAIPGVGPVTALAILTYRDEVGSFESVEQLLEVTGIGPATLEALRPYVTV